MWTYKCVCETELWRLIICISGDIDVRGPVEPVFTNNRYMRSMGIQSRKKDFVKLIIIVLLLGKQHDYLESWRTSIGVLLLVLVVEQSLEKPKNLTHNPEVLLCTVQASISVWHLISLKICISNKLNVSVSYDQFKPLLNPQSAWRYFLFVSLL